MGQWFSGWGPGVPCSSTDSKWPSSEPRAIHYLLLTVSAITIHESLSAALELERTVRETVTKSMPRSSAAEAGFVCSAFPDRLKTVPVKAMVKSDFR